MANSTTLHDITNVKIEEPRNPKHSKVSQEIVFETEDGKDHRIAAFGDFETLEIIEKEME